MTSVHCNQSQDPRALSCCAFSEGLTATRDTLITTSRSHRGLLGQIEVTLSILQGSWHSCFCGTRFCLGHSDGRMPKQPLTIRGDGGWKREPVCSSSLERRRNRGTIIPAGGHGPLLGHSEVLMKLELMKSASYPVLHVPLCAHANRVLLPPPLKSFHGQAQSSSSSRVQVCFQPQYSRLTQGVRAICHVHLGCSFWVPLFVPKGYNTGNLLHVWCSLCPGHCRWTRGT